MMRPTSFFAAGGLLALLLTACGGDLAEGESCAENATIQDGYCECVEGYTWCSNDPEDFDCCRVGGELCGNGACDGDESWATCADDCAFACGETVDITGDMTLPITWSATDRGWQGEPVYLDAASLASLQLSVDAGDVDTGIRGFAFGGEVGVSEAASREGFPVMEPAAYASIALPFSESTAPDACVGIVPFAWSDPGPTGTLHVLTRSAVGAALQVEAVIVGETFVTPGEIEAAFDVAAAVYDTAGAPTLTLREVRTLDWSRTIIDIETDQLNALRAAGSPHADAVVVYFVDSFTEYDTLGLAAGIPGPNGLASTPASGVVVAVEAHLSADGYDVETRLMGETVAHELGHQLGLFHTSEAEGTEHDPIGDTPTCDASYDADGDGTITAEECADVGGRNLMFWTAADFAQDELSATQSHLLGLSPVAE